MNMLSSSRFVWKFVFFNAFLLVVQSWADLEQWDEALNQHEEARAVETAGLVRDKEPVEVRLKSAALSLERSRREVRV